jgi:hypothetical protein
VAASNNQECLIVSLPLEEINGIDFTGVQAGPACAQSSAREKSLHGAKVV